MGLTPLSPADVYACWDWMRAGLLQVISKTDCRYRPEDVYMRLRSNTAWAYAIDDEIGFLVLTHEYDADGLVLFIWILWAEPGSVRGDGSFDFTELERLARSVNAVRIRMQSPRPGWGREPFFERVAVVYEHEVK